MKKVLKYSSKVAAKKADELFDEACALISLNATDLSTNDHTQEDLLKWAARSPAHAEALHSAQEIWTGVGEIDCPKLPKWEEIAGAPEKGRTTIFGAWQERFVSGFRQAAYPRIQVIAVILIVAGLTPLVFAGAGYLSDWRQVNVAVDGKATLNYATAIGEHHLVRLDDDTRLTLGGKSTVRIVYSLESRQIYLDEGEVFFQVAKDPDRPFVVIVGGLKVKAVGTEFNISRQQNSAIVSVVEGVVEATSPIPPPNDVSSMNKTPAAVRLEVGEQTKFSNAAGLSGAVHVNPDTVAAWRQGRLIFGGERLGDVIADINRYYDKHITIEGEKVASLRFSGVVHTDDIDEWFIALEAAFSLDVYQFDDKTVQIRNRRGR